MAAAGADEENSTTKRLGTAREDGRPARETHPLLLALAGKEPFDATSPRSDGAPDQVAAFACCVNELRPGGLQREQERRGARESLKTGSAPDLGRGRRAKPAPGVAPSTSHRPPVALGADRWYVIRPAGSPYWKSRLMACPRWKLGLRAERARQRPRSDGKSHCRFFDHELPAREFPFARRRLCTAN